MPGFANIPVHNRELPELGTWDRPEIPRSNNLLNSAFSKELRLVDEFESELAFPVAPTKIQKQKTNIRRRKVVNLRDNFYHTSKSRNLRIQLW